MKIQGSTPQRIGEFVKHVHDYLSWAGIHRRIVKQSTGLEPREFGGASPSAMANAIDRLWDDRVQKKSVLNQIENAWDRRQDAMVAARTLGKPLAVELEAAGIDSSGVLKILHCFLGAGGPDAIWRFWLDERASLERAAIRLSAAPAAPRDNAEARRATARDLERLTGKNRGTFQKAIPQGEKLLPIDRAIEIVESSKTTRAKRAAAPTQGRTAPTRRLVCAKCGHDHGPDTGNTVPPDRCKECGRKDTVTPTPVKPKT